MYVLDSATKILTITASAACDVTVSGFRDSTTPPSFSYQTKVGAGETKTVCPAGSAAAPRNVDNISITNTGASNTITVKMDDTGSPDVSTIPTSMVLAANEKGQFTHANGWDTIDANGTKKYTQGGWTIAAGKSGTLSNTITFAGTDGTTVTFPSTSATVARTDAGQTFTGTNTFGALTLTGNVGVTGTPTFTLTGCSLTAGAISGTTFNGVFVNNDAAAQLFNFRDATYTTYGWNIATNSVGNGNFLLRGVNAGTPTTWFDIDRTNGAVTLAGTLALTATATPTGTGAGAVGQIAWDTNYLYICTATNDWRRVALADF